MVLSYVLLGCITTQLVAYRQGYWYKDKWFTKGFVVLLYLTLVTRGALDMATLYSTVSTNWTELKRPGSLTCF